MRRVLEIVLCVCMCAHEERSHHLTVRVLLELSDVYS